MFERPIIGLCLVSIAGCAQPLYPGPSFLNSRNPEFDRNRFEKFDPLPSSDLGPETFHRPPGFDQQRPSPRRAVEGRRLLGVPTPLPTPVGPIGRREYPGVVGG